MPRSELALAFKRHARCYLRYSTERKLFSGNFPRNTPTDSRSIVFFTTNKCASTYLEKALSHINATALGLKRADMAQYLWHCTPDPVYEQLHQRRERIFIDKGLFYFPLRDYVDLNGIGDFRRILMLRDPRDVLVSNYYSRTISHPPPHDPVRAKKFEADRIHAKSLSIDGFVLHRAEKFLEIYENYRIRLAPQCNGPVLRYEDLILDFDRWIAGLAANLGVAIDDAMASHLYDMGGFARLGGENASRHVRKAIPGDYKEKLAPETIAVLNRRFGEILDWLSLDRE